MQSSTPFVSYAQNFEDVMLWRALGHIERGFYIDAGAWSPDLDSVTRAFSERGWRGINIEPNPHYFEQLTARRPDDINLKLAVGDHIGSVSMNYVPESGLSTADESFARDYREKGLELTEETVDLSTLAAICGEYVPQGSPIHFLKVDVEGFERAVLAGNDWKRFRPWIIVAEAMLPNCQVECHEEWEGIVASADYLFAYADGLNRYYVAREHQELVSSFKFPPNVFDEFAPASLAAALQNLEQSKAALKAAQLQVEALESTEAALKAAQLQVETLESTERLLEESQKRVEGLEQHLIAYRGRERELLVTNTIAAERYDTMFSQHQAILEQHQTILQQHEAILKSTSWRLTAPLRTLATLMPKSLRARLR